MSKVIRVGTRDSHLAMLQTEWVAQRLQEIFPDRTFQIIKIKTTGDKILGIPLSKIGDKGLFTKELDIALLERKVDLAVHSLKDLPTATPEGLTIAAITERWDARDALISRNGVPIQGLPRGATIATGSLRRKAQLLHFRPDFNIIDLRGNLNTRFRKFDESDWDAMILAVAGIERMGWQERITGKIPFDIMLPAVGQGSFAVVCRDDDEKTRKVVSAVNDAAAQIAGLTERAFLRTLEGGCQVPIGALAEVSESRIKLTGCVCSLDGTQLYRDSIEGAIGKPEETGIRLAEQLLDMGGREILQEIIESQRVSK